MENLIDLGIEDEEDEFVIQHIKIFEQADAQRNQLVKVSFPELESTYRSELIGQRRNSVMKSKT